MCRSIGVWECRRGCLVAADGAGGVLEVSAGV